MNEPNSRDEEITEMYVTGHLTVSAICAELDVTAPTVYKALRRCGVVPNRGKGVTGGMKEEYTMADPIVQQVVLLYEGPRKLPAKAIAKELQMPYGKVLRILEALKVTVVPGRRSKGKSLARRIIEYAQKHPEMLSTEIALQFGLNPDRVGRIMRRYKAISLTFQGSKEGKIEAVVEEVGARLREELGMEAVGPKVYQRKLPGL